MKIRPSMTLSLVNRLLLPLALLLPQAVFADAPPQVIAVQNLGSTPKVDGELGEWGSDGWIKIPVKPALPRDERAKYGLEPSGERNTTGKLEVEMKAGVAGGKLYIAVRYPDDAADAQYKDWVWRDNKYQRDIQLDDMFAVRFHLSGDYDRTMLSTKEYRVDVWLWSAARSNPTGFAEDMNHLITTKMQDSAAEYQVKDGPVIYISKQRDEGAGPYDVVSRPRENKGDKLVSFVAATPSGSGADVAAKGVWKAGHWSLEFARALNTSRADDVVFKPGGKLLGQIAVFNRSAAENKSVSEPLLFDFSAVK
jgi:hypothetical protein